MVGYDDVAAHFDRRYRECDYGEIGRALLDFIGSAPLTAILEVGCGTGHWLRAMTGRADLVVGLDSSAGMLRQAREVVPGVRLVRACAEQLPWRDRAFDRIVCITALHQFAGRIEFLSDVRRLLRPGGGFLSVDLDPHAGWDTWWVYEYFDAVHGIDLARFAPVRTIRSELVEAGFTWCKSFEAARIENTISANEALAGGLASRTVTSHLRVLSDAQFDRGLERLRQAAAEAVAGAWELQLVTDLRFYATEGWT